VANVENRRLAGSKSRQQFNDPRKGFRIISPLAGSFPFVERAARR
jgi:hypothetical protein